MWFTLHRATVEISIVLDSW